MKSLNTLIGVLFCLLIVVALMSGSEVNLAGSAETQAEYGGMPLDQMKKLPYDRRIVLADGFIVDNSNRLQCLHYEENGFCKADAISKPYQTLGSSLLSATSPHFMPAMEYTAGILKTMALEGGWDTIFVIGPNHGALGFPVTVSYADWETPFGTLEADEEALDMLMRSRQLKSSAGADERIME
ncbi:MAG: AmmeMemoRadiSam system protein B, partial [Oscillospiraceae bacterium]|nr:AmmeMemoRadiSam system protein B [Oscillospiraceae bacterium]